MLCTKELVALINFINMCFQLQGIYKIYTKEDLLPSHTNAISVCIHQF